MILFLDTEFTSLEQRYPSLISLALVKEDGDFFYTELPPSSYMHRASPWVQENVLPHLWGGSYRMLMPDLAANVTAWIEAIQDEVKIVTDSPDYDFDLMLKPLLDPWPSNLARSPAIFDSYAMGTDHQPWLSNVIDGYHTEELPVHHALHDAQALRAGYIAALDRGWKPRF